MVGKYSLGIGTTTTNISNVIFVNPIYKSPFSLRIQEIERDHKIYYVLEPTTLTILSDFTRSVFR